MIQDKVTYHHVREIDWSNSNFKRAAVIPFVKNNGKLWLCFGISRYNSCITTFGGMPELKDFDILETAIREYNEETNDNFPRLTVIDLFYCCAAKTSDSVSIFVEFPEIIKNFNGTKEIFNLLWVTSDQLLQMVSCSKVRLSYNSGDNTFAYRLSGDLKRIATSIVKFLLGPFKQPSTKSLTRTKMKHIEKNVTVLNGFQHLLEDLKQHKTLGSCVVSIFGNKFGIGRTSDKMIFCMHLSEMEHAFKLISDKADLLDIKAEFLCMDNTKNYPFSKKYRIRNLPEYYYKGKLFKNLVDQIKYLLDCEEDMYIRRKKKNIFFNEKRAHFLTCLNIINTHHWKSKEDILNLIPNYLTLNHDYHPSRNETKYSKNFIIDCLIDTGMITINPH